jgi:hypothetical protein
MRCRACEMPLDPDDNYCRKCGAPVRVLDATPVAVHSDAVTIAPSAPALLAGAARPLATGAAAVAAGALVRFALRQALRGLVRPARSAAPTPAAPSRAVTAQGRGERFVEIAEVIWYRRIVRS